MIRNGKFVQITAIRNGKFGKLVNIKDFVEVVHERLEEKYMMKS